MEHVYITLGIVKFGHSFDIIVRNLLAHQTPYKLLTIIWQQTVLYGIDIKHDNNTA